MFNVGDKVVIRDWHDVAKERGQEKGKIYCEAHCVYDFSMNDYAGEPAVIEEVQEYEGTGEFWYCLVSESGELLPYHWTDSMLARPDVSAAEEKFAGRPQLQDGDIVRAKLSDNGKTRCFPVWRDSMSRVYVDCGGDIFTYEQIVAVYRFDGRDFKYIWESEEYKLQKWNKALANAAEAARRVGVSLDTAAAALVNIAKAERDKARKASK